MNKDILKFVLKCSPQPVLWLSGICENHRCVYFQDRLCIKNHHTKKSQRLLHSKQPNMFESWLTKAFSPFYLTTAANPIPISKGNSPFHPFPASHPYLTFPFSLKVCESGCSLHVQRHRLTHLIHFALDYQAQWHFSSLFLLFFCFGLVIFIILV